MATINANAAKAVFKRGAIVENPGAERAGVHEGEKALGKHPSSAGIQADAGESSAPAPAPAPALKAPTRAPSSRPQPTAAGPYEVGRVYLVPHAEINSNPEGPRTLYPSNEVEDMIEKLRLAGEQREAATGFVDGNGRVTLIDGETRNRGTKALGWPGLLIQIKAKPENERELYEQAYSANADRRLPSPLDDTIRWNDLLNRGLYKSQAELSRRLGKKPEVVSRVMQLSILPYKVIKAIADHPDLVNIKMLTALREYYEVCGEGGGPGEQEVLDLVFEVSTRGLGYREVEARRKALSHPIKRTRSEKQQFTFRGVKGELRVFGDEGRVELAIKGLEAVDLETLQEKLKAALAAE